MIKKIVMTNFIVLSLFFIVYFFSSAAGLLPEDFQKAGEVLSDSGFLSMSLTLQIAFSSLTLNSSTAATIFAPSDAAFFQSGQPSLALLQYHISPFKVDVDDLESLPIGATIPTLLFNRSLIITASSYEGCSSINNVSVGETPIYDDGSLVIYGVEEFFNSSFKIQRHSAPESSPPEPYGTDDDVDAFSPATDLLMSRGYSRMATFLDMQLSGFVNHTGLTIFAPFDEAIDGAVSNFSDFSLIFRRHVVPKRLVWTDMVKLEAGTVMPTFSEGFQINVTGSGGVLELNRLPVTFPDMYRSNWIAVHGLNRLLTSPENQEPTADAFFEFDGNDEQNPSEYGEY